MMRLVRRIIYTPFINFLIRNCLKPFSLHLPPSLKIPVAGIIKIGLIDNKSILMATNQTNYLTKKVFWGGIEDYEFAVMRVFLKLIPEITCFLDIGSNIGYYSLIAAKLNPGMTVYAFEPLPSANLFLQKNINLNQLNNIRQYQIALSDRDGEEKFFATKMSKALYLKHHISGTSNLAQAKDNHTEVIIVRTQTLDNFIRENSIHKVDLLKLDTEGTENMILEGGKELILREKPVIISELLPRKIERELETFYRQNNYLFYVATPDGLRRVNSLNGYSMTKEDFFFVHESKKRMLVHFIAK